MSLANALQAIVVYINKVHSATGRISQQIFSSKSVGACVADVCDHTDGFEYYIASRQRQGALRFI